MVKGGDGQYRGMYAVESPECWFEDFGTGTLASGQATMKLDPLFAQHVHTDDYHVFLTEHDATSHHIIGARRPGGLHRRGGPRAMRREGEAAADLNGTFSYRVVAKRNDIEGERLPVWQMPTPAFTKPAPTPTPLPGTKP